MSNYPPGVTGFEPHLAGYLDCEECVCEDPLEAWRYYEDKDGEFIACDHQQPCDCDPCECDCHNGRDGDSSYVDEGY